MDRRARQGAAVSRRWLTRALAGDAPAAISSSRPASLRYLEVSRGALRDAGVVTVSPCGLAMSVSPKAALVSRAAAV